MPSMNDVIAGASALASDVQQIIDAWKGTAGKGIVASFTAVNDAINFTLALKNNDIGSKVLICYKNDGTILFQVDKNGVVASADGVTGAAQIPTLTATQTFTNKTLTSPTVTGTVAGGAIYTAPHMTTPVVDSGGLTVTAGGIALTAGSLKAGASASGQAAVQSNDTGSSLWVQDTFTLANNAIQQLVTGQAAPLALVFISHNGGNSAIVQCSGGGHTTAIFAQGAFGALFNVTNGNAGTVNVSWVTSAYMIENKSGQALTFKIFTML